MGETTTSGVLGAAIQISEAGDVAEGGEYTLQVRAKDAQGCGIAKFGDFVVFVKNAKTRIGNIYKVKVTKVHRTFAYAELCENRRQVIGNGSLVKF